MPMSLHPSRGLSGHDISILDGIVAATDAELNIVVTSPNATYVPKLSQGRACIYMVADGTYGAFDPTCWPQVHHPDFAYFAAVPKMATSPHLYTAIWNNPRPTDFKVLQGVLARNFGLLTDDFLQPFGDLIAQLNKQVTAHTSADPSNSHPLLIHHQCVVRQTYERLRHIPATLSDHQVQVSLLRRHWLLAKAYMRFSLLDAVPENYAPRSVVLGLMGAWTDQAAVALDLYRRGIPVWYVRNRVYVPSDARLGREVEFTPPPTTYAARMGEVPVYQGPVGYHSLWATQRTIQRYHDTFSSPTTSLQTMDSALNAHRPSATTPSSLDLHLPASHLLTLNPGNIGLVTKRSQKCHPSHVRHGRDKCKEYEHPWMPPSIPSWQRALSEVDRSAPARRPAEIWPYWIPEPALLVGSQERSRQLRYLMNWIRARPIWISLLPSPDRPAANVSPQDWRTYLNGVPVETKTDTTSGQRASHIKQIFNNILHVDDIEVENNGWVNWHHYAFKSEPPLELCPWILWEAHELSFRYELLALDRACRCPAGLVEEIQAQEGVANVFSGQGLWSVTNLPAADEPGLFATVPQRRIHALNALRDVVVRWPGCPQPLKRSTALSTLDNAATIEAFEYWVATFYVRTFFAYAGRPPIVPHFLPSPIKITVTDR